MKKYIAVASVMLALVFFAGCTKQSSTMPAVPADGTAASQQLGSAPSDMEGSTGEGGSEVTASQTSETRVDLEAKNFSFGTNKITVKKGSKLVVAVTNAEGFHDFVIDELAVSSGPIDQGATWEVTIPTDKAGTYEYYCSVGKHREMGMKGTLVIEE